MEDSRNELLDDRQKWQSAYLSLASSRRDDRDSGTASGVSSPTSSRLSSHDPEDRDSGYRELAPCSEEPLIGDMLSQVSNVIYKLTQKKHPT